MIGGRGLGYLGLGDDSSLMDAFTGGDDFGDLGTDYSSTDISNLLGSEEELPITGPTGSTTGFSIGLPTTGSYNFGTSPANSSTNVNWGQVETQGLLSAINTAGQVIKQSTIPAGQLQETLANGQTITYQQPAGSAALAVPGLTSSISSYLPLLLLAGGAILVVSLMKKH